MYIHMQYVSVYIITPCIDTSNKAHLHTCRYILADTYVPICYVHDVCPLFEVTILIHRPIQKALYFVAQWLNSIYEAWPLRCIISVYMIFVARVYSPYIVSSHLGYKVLYV